MAWLAMARDWLLILAVWAAVSPAFPRPLVQDGEDGLQASQDGEDGLQDAQDGEDALQASQDGLQASQDGLQASQDGLQASQDAEEDGLQASQDGLQASQDAEEDSQDGEEDSQDGEDALQASQDGEEDSQDGEEDGLQASQDGEEDGLHDSQDDGCDSEPHYASTSIVPVLKFLKGPHYEIAMQSISNEPIYLCEDDTIIVRFATVQHAAPFLTKDGLQPENMLSVPEHCLHEWWTKGPWLYLRMYFKGCHLTRLTIGATSFNSVTLQYFDNLLQKNVKGTATCEEMSPLWAMSALPQVTCTGGNATVMLPPGSREVKVVGHMGLFDRNEYVKWHRHQTPEALVIQILGSKMTGNGVAIFYSDSFGELSAVKISCCLKARRLSGGRSGRDTVDYFALWGLEDIPTTAAVHTSTAALSTAASTTRLASSTTVDPWLTWDFDVPPPPYKRRAASTTAPTTTSTPVSTASIATVSTTALPTTLSTASTT